MDLGCFLSLIYKTFYGDYIFYQGYIQSSMKPEIVGLFIGGCLLMKQVYK